MSSVALCRMASVTVPDNRFALGLPRHEAASHLGANATDVTGGRLSKPTRGLTAVSHATHSF